MVVETLPPNAWDTVEADLAIGFEPTAEMMPYAAPLAEERIAVIVHPENPVGTLKEGELQDIFRGQTQEWQGIEGNGGGLGEVEIWVLPESSTIREVFDENVLADLPVGTQARLGADPQAILDGISTNPNAIGYVPAAWLNDAVHEVRLPANLRGGMQTAVLALTQAEPQGHALELLLCLQQGEGASAIERQYEAFSP